MHWSMLLEWYEYVVNVLIQCMPHYFNWMSIWYLWLYGCFKCFIDWLRRLSFNGICSSLSTLYMRIECVFQLFFHYRCVCSLEPMCVFVGTDMCARWNRCLCSLEPMCVLVGTDVCVRWNRCVCSLEPMFAFVWSLCGRKPEHPYETHIPRVMCTKHVCVILNAWLVLH